MQDDLTNRVAEPRRRGRPPASAPREPAQEAVPVVLAERRVPPLNCPKCGRGQQPKTLRWVGEVANCTCSLCGGRFDYTPPRVRPV